MTAPDQSLENLLETAVSSQAPIAARLDAISRLADRKELQCVNALLQILREDTEPRVVLHTVTLLSRKQVYAAVDSFIALVECTGLTAIELSIPRFKTQDVGIRIRTTVIQALGRLGDQRAIDPLMHLLGDMTENYRIRLSAAESLGRLGDSKALNPLMHIVQDEEESSQYLKESAVKALGMLGDIRALDPLLDLFENQKGFFSKMNFLKEQLVEAIGRLGTQHNRALNAVLEALHDESSTIRLTAVESLLEFKDPVVIPHLMTCLSDSYDDVAIAAVNSLYHLGGEALMREILQTHENLPQFVRDELESYVP
jgi:HEAT repeat protein